MQDGEYRARLIERGKKVRDGLLEAIDKHARRHHCRPRQLSLYETDYRALVTLVESVTGQPLPRENFLQQFCGVSLVVIPSLGRIIGGRNDEMGPADKVLMVRPMAGRSLHLRLFEKGEN